MHTDTPEMIALIQSCGYRVFMRDPSDGYCFYTDAEGRRIGSAQWSSYNWSVSTVRPPCRRNGTGTIVSNEINPETLAQALYGSLYSSWAARCRESAWNASYVEVAPVVAEEGAP